MSAGPAMLSESVTVTWHDYIKIKLLQVTTRMCHCKQSVALVQMKLIIETESIQVAVWALLEPHKQSTTPADCIASKTQIQNSEALLTGPKGLLATTGSRGNILPSVETIAPLTDFLGWCTTKWWFLQCRETEIEQSIRLFCFLY